MGCEVVLSKPMANARMLAPWVGKEDRAATYHLVSRIVERQFHLHAEGAALGKS